MKNWSFILIFLLILQGCEDKESAAENVEEKTTEKVKIKRKSTSKEVSEKKKKEQPVRMIDTVDGQLLQQEELIPFLTEYGKENPENKVRIKTKFGNIDVRLFKDTPLHRANFILLVKEDYFDETYFHRVVENFVIQAGNSDNASTNRKRYKIGSYLIPNEYTSAHPHVRGAFAAAKYSEQNVSNASSPYEFYIVQSKKGAHHLNQEHTVFGEVIDGMDVVDTIAQQRTDEGEWPLRNIEIDVEILD